MNKKNKWIIRVTIIGILLFGGYKMVQYKKTQDYMTTQKPRIEKYLKYNYHNVTSVTLTGIKKNPVDIYITGYINDDPNMNITASINTKDQIEGVSGLMWDFVEKNSKFDKNKSVSEIEEEEAKETN